MSLLARRVGACLTLAACTFFWQTPATAQTPSPLAEWQYAAGIALIPLFVDEPPKWQVELGLGSSMTPRYEGSDQYDPQLGPVISVRYRDIAFFSLGEGLGVNLFSGKGYRAGAALAYDVGRREIKYPPLRGMGNINPAPELKLFAEYVIFPVVLRSNVRRAVGGHDGWIGDVSAYMPVAGSKKFFVFVGPSATFADAQHTQSYFGVTPQQAARSGYPVYTAQGGLKSAKFGVSATWFFTEDWFVQALGAGERLYGDAADSPIIQTRRQFNGGVYIARQF